MNIVKMLAGIFGFLILSMITWQCVRGPGYKFSPEARLIIFSGDDVVNEVGLKDKFIFVLKKDRIYYTDTAQNGFWSAEYSDMSMIGEGQRREILKRIKSE